MDKEVHQRAKDLCLDMMKEEISAYVDHRSPDDGITKSTTALQDMLYAIACMSGIKSQLEETAFHPSVQLMALLTEKLMGMYADFTVTVAYSAMMDGAPDDLIRSGFRDAEHRAEWQERMEEKRKMRGPIDFERIAEDLGLNKEKKDETD
jgi:hypothetical protein